MSIVYSLFSFLWFNFMKGFNKVEEFFTGKFNAMYGLAITRILFGITGLGLIITNFPSRHYSFGVGSAWFGQLSNPGSDFPNIPIFSMFYKAAINPPVFTAMIIGLALLTLVIIAGWKTRFILPIYFVLWVSFIELNSVIGDEGDNAYRIFMIALFFTDTTRRWSVDSWLRKRKTGEVLSATDGNWLFKLFNNVAIAVMMVHVVFIYMAGGLYKAGGNAWKHGYAIYDVLQTQLFGVNPWLNDLLTTYGVVVAIMTWSSIVFQCAFPFLLLRRETRVIALLGIVGFHVSIGVLMGIPWFSLAMIAVDAIFISDKSFEKVIAIVKKVYNREYDYKALLKVE